MARLLSLAVLGFASFSLASPQTSQAATPFGISVNIGPGSFTYQQGYPAYYAPVAPVIVPRGPEICDRPVYVGPRPVVVFPEYRHWEFHHHGHHGYHGPVFVPYRGVHGW